MTTRERTRSSILGAVLSASLALVASAFGFATAALCAVCVLVVVLLAERIRAQST